MYSIQALPALASFVFVSLFLLFLEHYRCYRWSWDERKLRGEKKEIGWKLFFFFGSFPNNINRYNVGAGHWLIQLELIVNYVFFVFNAFFYFLFVQYICSLFVCLWISKILQQQLVSSKYFLLQGNIRNNVVLKIIFLIHILFLLYQIPFTNSDAENIFLLVHLQLQACISTCTDCLWSSMCLWPASETWRWNVRIPTVRIILDPFVDTFLIFHPDVVFL